MGHLIFLILMKFQSTLPRRERLDRTVELRDGYYISIHAPAKGATLAIFLAVAIFIYFNPRSREGSDLHSISSSYSSFDFNPRSREGSDR